MMKVSLFGALVGGAIGALVWALVVRIFHFELGFIAWGVGIAVGFCSLMFGGRGNLNGIVCAMVCLLSIFTGKVLSVQWSLDPDDIKSEIASSNSEFSKEEVADFAAKIMREWSWADSAEVAKGNLDVLDFGFAGLGVLSALALGRTTDQGGGGVFSPGQPLEQR